MDCKICHFEDIFLFSTFISTFTPLFSPEMRTTKKQSATQNVWDATFSALFLLKSDSRKSTSR